MITIMTSNWILEALVAGNITSIPLTLFFIQLIKKCSSVLVEQSTWAKTD